jgi:hypothetical protein
MKTVSIAKLALAALATAAALSPALAQTKGGLYVLHTRAVGSCPGLDWHVNVEPNGSLVGFVAWDQMKHMAKLEGSIAKNGSFDMNAQEVGGAARKAVVKGAAAGDYITMSIDGSGTGCDKQIFQVPRFEGGTSGGGG